MDIYIPIRIEVDDYHEFDYLQDYFKQLNNKIKVEEIGSADKGYIGIVYYNKKDADYHELRKEIEEEISEYENRIGDPLMHHISARLVL